MVAISFSVKKQEIIEGKKTHTFRVINTVQRYRQLCKSLKVSLYWKMRSKESEYLFDVRIINIRVVRFKRDLISETKAEKRYNCWLEENNNMICEADAINLARMDGFDSVGALITTLVGIHGEDIVFTREFMGIEWLPPGAFSPSERAKAGAKQSPN